ncbi:MAG: 50S ribosomal protein L11 methyltransferase [Nitrosomonas sp.]|nr:50S ribosomal protein L11 methyltransferase [Nitrosomonas sp.]
MSWLSLTFRVDALHVDAVGDCLLELGALSVDVHDAEAGTTQEQPLFGEPGAPLMRFWEQAELTVLLKPDCDIAAIMQAITQSAHLLAQPAYSVTDIQEQDWVRLTQSQFSPIQISPQLWIVPSWHTPPDPTAINLKLDPGIAFGTGSHPTTRLCLEWLGETVQPSDSVLDYGCGSGILAIAALKLGANQVIGVDIDPNAITASRENAAINHCDRHRLSFGSHFSSSDPIGKASASPVITLVVANILTNPLIMLAPILTHALQAGGRIGLSGILETQAEEVMQIYSDHCKMQITACDQGWVLLTGKKLPDRIA